jgi:hypothetical protein
METFDLRKKMTRKQLGRFVEFILQISKGIGFKVSSRGWGYILEQKGIITKDQFDKVESVINRCRKLGLLPVDFVAEEAARAFTNVEIPDSIDPRTHALKWIGYGLRCPDFFTPDWWQGEKYYIQAVVEKIDLVTLMEPVCARFHIPIANAKGWSSISQRAEYCRRFKAAEARGLKCVLLYCGDHDPDGLRISDTLRGNLRDVSQVIWSDGVKGYDPTNLEIARFGLEFDFIEEHGLTWIDNLITGSGLDLASKDHRNHHMPYLQRYLETVGERKCEANSIVIKPELGEQLCERAILGYLGEDAEERFEARAEEVRNEIERVLEESGARGLVESAIEALKDHAEG